MSHEKNHPDRSELMAAATKRRNPFAAHLKVCRECRIIYQLMSKVSQQGGPDIECTTEEAVIRHVQIPLLHDKSSSVRTIPGTVVYDSWFDRAAVNIRDVTFGHVRRIKMKAGKTSLEIVAERHEGGWSFVARIYEKNAVSFKYVLTVGSKRLLSKAQGFYHWSSIRPPRIIKVKADNTEIVFERLQWA